MPESELDPGAIRERLKVLKFGLPYSDRHPLDDGMGWAPEHWELRSPLGYMKILRTRLRATLQGLLDRLGEVTKDRSLIGRWIILLYCGVVGGAAQARSLAQAQPEPEARALVAPESFVEVVALARARKEGILANQLEGDVHLVRFEPGVIEFHPGARAPNDLAGRLGRCLQDWTGRRWMVGVTSASGAPSLREQRQAREAERLEEAARDPLVQEVMSLFPGARIVAVREAAADPGRDRDDPEPPTANEAQEDERWKTSARS